MEAKVRFTPSFFQLTKQPELSTTEKNDLRRKKLQELSDSGRLQFITTRRELGQALGFTVDEEQKAVSFIGWLVKKGCLKDVLDGYDDRGVGRHHYTLTDVPMKGRRGAHSEVKPKRKSKKGLIAKNRARRITKLVELYNNGSLDKNMTRRELVEYLNHDTNSPAVVVLNLVHHGWLTETKVADGFTPLYHYEITDRTKEWAESKSGITAKKSQPQKQAEPVAEPVAEAITEPVILDAAQVAESDEKHITIKYGELELVLNGYTLEDITNLIKGLK